MNAATWMGVRPDYKKRASERQGDEFNIQKKQKVLSGQQKLHL